MREVTGGYVYKDRYIYWSLTVIHWLHKQMVTVLTSIIVLILWRPRQNTAIVISCTAFNQKYSDRVMSTSPLLTLVPGAALTRLTVDGTCGAVRLRQHNASIIGTEMATSAKRAMNTFDIGGMPATSPAEQAKSVTHTRTLFSSSFHLGEFEVLSCKKLAP